MVNGLKNTILQCQDFYLFCFRGIVSVFRPPWNIADILDQMEYMGADAVIIVGVLATFIGMALSIQSAAECIRGQLKQTTPIIAFTAKAFQEDREKCATYGHERFSIETRGSKSA